MNNEQRIWNSLMEFLGNPYGVAGVMGNLYAESALNPQNLQNSYEKSLNKTDASYTAGVDNGSYKDSDFIYDRAGYGLAQWTYWSRKKNLLEFAKSKGVSIGDLDMQLEFLKKELTAYKLVPFLKGATSVRETSNKILLDFEAPASKDTQETQDRRASYSQVYFDRYAKKGETTGMKYSDANKPMVCMMTKSTCYRQTRTMDVKGVLWHSTGANNPNLKRYVQPSDNDPNYQQLIAALGKNQYGNDWNHIEHQAGLNCWIGKLANGEVTTVQTMPWNYRPWGCGSGSKGSCNSGWIQFEICEDALTDANYFNKVYQEACELTAYLCKMFNIDPHGSVTVNGVKIPTILCHQDSYRLGFGGNHGDIYHWFPKFGKNMETVRDDVARLMGSSAAISAPVAQTPAATDTTVRYQAQVNATSGLNCRTTNSTSGAIVKTYPNGTVLTISKENNGWGYTGEGWVSLSYVKKLGSTEISKQPQVNNVKEDDDMTQEKFNEMMNNYLNDLATKDTTWAQDYLTWANKAGIMKGDDHGRMMPLKFCTRQETVVMLKRLYEMITREKK